jgi:putative ABC transport system substrate-binding protein
MLRRAFLLVALTGACTALAQPASRRFRLGVVYNTTPIPDGGSAEDPWTKAFREGLREHGWNEGRNIDIHWRSVLGQFDRRPAVIAELVQMPVDIILVAGTFATKEAMHATRTIPIVMFTTYAPVDNRLVASTSRPGGNVTGISMDVGREMHGKRLAILKKFAPNVSRVAFLVPSYADPRTSLDFAPETEAAAASLGMTMFHASYSKPEHIGNAIDEAVKQGAKGLVVGEWAPINVTEHQLAIHRAAERHRLPVLHCLSGTAETGGLISYGADQLANYRRAGFYVDRILKGAKPAEMPIEQPRKIELVINRKAAKAIGLAIPLEVLALADRVID